ncbi:uncharacterized protein LOC126791792 isoform X1 [Argentina anserina]|uniref:uncharacterized protein LOC126791792 isoform X1 n=1 Tax=Argentina anserina TaxID=57926 RepID=UPI002176793C|nr:uncharacterized protein LOC126791792 isoform X1 [Potentilla anserina]XP_050374229.1 uncharacterized protein LOC126791792 isoform X1 [Potentilla anserina]
MPPASAPRAVVNQKVAPPTDAFAPDPQVVHQISSVPTLPAAEAIEDSANSQASSVQPNMVHDNANQNVNLRSNVSANLNIDSNADEGNENIPENNSMWCVMLLSPNQCMRQQLKMQKIQGRHQRILQGMPSGNHPDLPQHLELHQHLFRVPNPSFRGLCGNLEFSL